jgi:hypothetical protein
VRRSDETRGGRHTKALDSVLREIRKYDVLIEKTPGSRGWPANYALLRRRASEENIDSARRRAWGCAPQPIPLAGHTGSHKGIDDEMVEFIRVGTTTREDVVLQLGAPDRDDENTLQYEIERYGGGVHWMSIVPCQLGTRNQLTSVRTTRKTFLIEFDANSVVKAYRFIDKESQWQTFCW